MCMYATYIISAGEWLNHSQSVPGEDRLYVCSSGYESFSPLGPPKESLPFGCPTGGLQPAVVLLRLLT